MEKKEKDEKKYMIKSMGIAERLISNIESDRNLTRTQKNDKAYVLVDAVFAAIESGEVVSGSGDDFHNFAVSLLRLSEDYETAFDIIEVGIGLHPSNTDLLSDAIKYGINCGKQDVCEKRISELNKLPKSLWTWRAFSFYIDYILATLGNIKDATEQDIEERVSVAFELSKEYQKYFPQLEDSWYSEYEIYRSVNNRREAMRILKTIVEHQIDNIPLLCPKSWLRYADECMDIGDTAEARKYIVKLRQNPEAADSVNFSYVYYLDGLSLMKEMMADDEYPRERVEKAYRSFKLGLKHKSLYGNVKTKIIDKIQTLEELSDIPYSWDTN